MKTSKIFTAVAAALTLAAGSALATGTAAPAAMEKCVVTGTMIVVAGKNDCKAPSHGCQGQGTGAAGSGDWINVPAGECAKINAGDTSGLSDDLKAKIGAAAK